MPHTPERLRFVQENGALRIFHDAAPCEVAQLVTRALRCRAIAPAASFEQRHRFFNRVKPGDAQIAPVQPVYPGALISLVGDQRHPDLRNGNRQRVMHEAGAITRLDSAIEEQAAMNAFECGHVNLVTPCPRGSLGMRKNVREEFCADALANTPLLLNRLCDLLFKRRIHSGQVISELPRIDIQGILDRLPKGGLKLVGLHRQDVVRARPIMLITVRRLLACHVFLHLALRSHYAMALLCLYSTIPVSHTNFDNITKHRRANPETWVLPVQQVDSARKMKRLLLINHIPA